MELQTAPAETLRGFPLVTDDDAPEAVRPAFDFARESFGFVPNLTRLLANAPATGKTYFDAQQNLIRYGTLSDAENNVVQMAVAVANACRYCTAGHHLAGQVFFGSEEADLQALRAGRPLADPKLQALRQFAERVYETTGRVSDAELEAFYDAGYSQAQALDVVTNIAVKVLSNVANQLAVQVLDEPIEPLADGLAFDTEYR